MKNLEFALFTLVLSGALSVRADALPARPVLLEPSWIFDPTFTHLRLDAWNYDSFTTNETGGVTAWADQSGNGHDATAYQIGGDQQYGTLGLTNGVPAYFMGPRASRIDLAFTQTLHVRTVFWVMDIVGKHAYDTVNQAFFLGHSGHWHFHRGYNGEIANNDADEAWRTYGLFRVDGDGSYSGNLKTTYPPASGTHLYSTVASDDLYANQISRDRVSTTRVGGRALSELIILTRALETNEVETVEAYLNAKWFAASETVSSSVDAKLAYPSLTVDDGASFTLGPDAYARPERPAMAVFGTLTKGTAAKIRIVSGTRTVPNFRTILACGATSGITGLDDFELVDFPDEATFAWDAAACRLTMSCERVRTLAPAILTADSTRRATLWLDAADAATFTTNETGGVTAWADKSGSGNNAIAYQIGDDQRYGTRGITNNCYAYRMGEAGSRIDLKFVKSNATVAERNYEIGTVYWVMDIQRETPYDAAQRSYWKTAFFLGAYDYYDFHRGVEGATVNSMISDSASASGKACFYTSDFRIDGTYYDPRTIKPPPGTHMYSASMTNGLAHGSFLSSDRGSLYRNGGRALSELLIFGFVLTEREKAHVENYLNAKWYGAGTTLAEEAVAAQAISFPNLVLNDGGRFRVVSTALGADAGVTVYGTLRKGTAEKVAIEFVGTPVGVGSRALFACEDLVGYDRDDFVVTGLPADVTPYWDGNRLLIDLRPPTLVPPALKAAGASAPWLWLDAAAASTFTTNETGGVTAWADRGAYGHNATAYGLGDDEQFGTVGLTNGVPAYLMGPIGSRIDLAFEICKKIRTVFWVMDIAGKGKDNNHLAFFLGCSDAYHFHRGYAGQITGTDANDGFEFGDFAIDGDHSYTGKLGSTVPPTRTHLYASVTTNDCSANRLSYDRSQAVTRSGGRALSELAIFDRELTAFEYADVESYLNAKWFEKYVTVAEPVAAPVSYPYLTVDSGAGFAVDMTTLSKTEAAVTVYGSLHKGTADKISVALSGTLRSGVRKILSCSDAGSLTLDDFEVTGLPKGAKLVWDGNTLATEYHSGLMVILR